MRKVVDSNFLQSEALREYLSKSANNYAILTDYAWMEAYKGNTLASIYRSMEILAQHPRQVIVLKGTQIVCGLSGRRSGLQRRLVDEEQTREFDSYCRDLDAAKRGNPFLQNQLLNLGREATGHIDRMLGDAGRMLLGINETAKTYTAAELHQLRTGRKFTDQMTDKLIKDILTLAAFMFRDHPRVTELPSMSELRNTFIFRAALCGYLLAIHWISMGGVKDARPDRVRNDIIDISFATYATFFDGVLTNDNKLNCIYHQANFILNALFPGLG